MTNTASRVYTSTETSPAFDRFTIPLIMRSFRSDESASSMISSADVGCSANSTSARTTIMSGSGSEYSSAMSGSAGCTAYASLSCVHR